MPRGDGSGPIGMGPMTGRGAGFCSGFPSPGYMNPRVGLGRGYGRGFGRGSGRGYGMGFGRGWGFRRVFNYSGMPGGAQYDYNEPKVNEKEFLSNQVEFLETQLHQLKERLSTLNKETE
jgi:hypothetical protein